MSAGVIQGFLNPPAFTSNMDFSEDDTYEIGTTIQLLFSTDLPNYEIYLWQQKQGLGGATQGPAIYTSPSNTASATDVQLFNWTSKLYAFDLSYMSVFYFGLSTVNSSGVETRSFISHYVNLTQSPVAPPPALQDYGATTVTLGTAATQATTMTLTSSNISASTTASISASADPTGTSSVASSPTAPLSSSTVLNTGAATGVVIGVTLISLLLIALGIWLGLKCMRNRKSGASDSQAEYPEDKIIYTKKISSTYSGDMSKTSQGLRYELGASRPRVHELEVRQPPQEMP